MYTVPNFKLPAKLVVTLLDTITGFIYKYIYNSLNTKYTQTFSKFTGNIVEVKVSTVRRRQMIYFKPL
jgi:hypothetical protein